MESLSRLVSESLARHGFDRPVDFRRLKWSRWFRCESHHSLLFVPSKPGVFAVAEEVMDLGKTHVESAASAVPARPAPSLSNEQSAAELQHDESFQTEGQHRFDAVRRMLAVSQFFEADDMAFVLDRMLSTQNPMRARLATGRYFVRFVAIEDQSQRRSITNALNQWIVCSAEKATGIGSQFSSSLELTPATEHTYVETAASAVPRSEASAPGTTAKALSTPTSPHLNSGATGDMHGTSLFPSGF